MTQASTPRELVVGPFTVVRPIARGGGGEVWLATHPSLGDVALKLLDEAHARDPRFLRAFQREIRTIARLAHPHVVWLVDHGLVTEREARESEGRWSAGRAWFAMELARGSLASARGTLAWTELRAVLRALLGALAHAHARGVVHADVKPENLLWTGPSEAPVIKLADFGVAQVLAEAGAGLRGGTPGFMAPEQAGRGPVGPWSDLFAVGRTALALLRSDAAEVPSGFEAWVARLCAPAIADRFGRAADALRALEALGAVVSARVAPDAGSLDPAVTWVVDEGDPWLAPPSAASGEGARVPSSWRLGLAVAPPSPAALGLHGLRDVPFVGREVERDLLWSELGAAAQDGPRVVRIEGPSGAGRSRLLGWLAERAHETGAAEVFTSRDGEAGDGLRGLVARAVGGPHGRTALVDLGLDPVQIDVLTGAAPASREARRAAVRAWWGRLAADRPVVWCLDDARADGEAVAFVRALLGRAAHERLPVLVAVAVSDGAGGAALPEGPRVREIALAPLSIGESVAVLRDGLGLEPALARDVAVRCGGHPVFATRVVDDWVRSGALVSGPTGLRLREGWSSAVRPHAALGPGDHDTPDDRDAVAVAALLGWQVDADEFARAVALVGLQPASDLVDRLMRTRVLTATPTGFRFLHLDDREAAIAGARGSPRWAALCLGCAGAIDREAHGERVGRLLAEAGRVDEAVALLLDAAAARAVMGDSASAEALCDVLAGLLGPEEHGNHARVGLVRSDATRVAGRHQQALQLAQTARDQAAKAADPGLVARASRAVAYALLDAGRLDECRTLLLEEIHREPADPPHRARMFFQLGRVALRRGALDEAAQHLDTAEALLPPDRVVSFADLWRTRGMLRQRRGDPVGAVEALVRARAGYERNRAHASVSQVDNDLGDLARRAGDLDAAAEHYTRAAATARSLGSVDALLSGLNLCLVQLELGDTAAARVPAENVVREAGSMGWPVLARYGHACLLACAAADLRWAEWDLHWAGLLPLLSGAGGSEPDLAVALEHGATWAAAAGEVARAEAAREAARTVWRAAGMPARS